MCLFLSAWLSLCRWISGSFLGSVEEILAFVSYLPLCGDGASRGDGIIPLEVALLEGSTHVELPTSKHSGRRVSHTRFGTFRRGRAAQQGLPSFVRHAGAFGMLLFLFLGRTVCAV